MLDVAPPECIVCRRPHPGGENMPGWSYLAGARPVGALACSPECTAEAVRRFRATGRCDATAGGA